MMAEADKSNQAGRDMQGQAETDNSSALACTRRSTGREDREKKEQAIDSTARRDAIIWVIQAVRTAAVAGMLPIYPRD